MRKKPITKKMQDKSSLTTADKSVQMRKILTFGTPFV